MTTKVVTMTQLREQLRGFARATVEKQRAAVVRGLYRTLPSLVERSPVDTGLFAQSWDVKADESKARIGNYAPHAPMIEYGARPFVPPLKPLLAWAKRVLKDPSQPPDYSPAVRRLAFYTRKKISEQGLEPKHILTDSLDLMLSNIEKELEALNNG